MAKGFAKCATGKGAAKCASGKGAAMCACRCNGGLPSTLLLTLAAISWAWAGGAGCAPSLSSVTLSAITSSCLYQGSGCIGGKICVATLGYNDPIPHVLPAGSRKWILTISPAGASANSATYEWVTDDECDVFQTFPLTSSTGVTAPATVGIS